MGYFCIGWWWGGWRPRRLFFWRGFDWRRTLAAGLCATGLIESWQLCVGRAFDIDDILLNTLGVFCGYGLWRLTRRLDPGFAEKFHVRMSEESADECDD